MKYTNGNIFLDPQIEQLDKTDEYQICTKEHIAKAIEYVHRGFTGKTDKYGRPAIMHPMAVGLMGHTDDETVVGFLHDIIEDTDITDTDLHKDFPRPIVNTVKLLTRDIHIPYMSYIRNIAESGDKLAIAVKLNDLRHNLLRTVADDLFSLKTRYEQAFKILSEKV